MKRFYYLFLSLLLVSAGNHALGASLEVNFESDTIYACIGQAYDLEPIISGGQAPYSYDWSDGSQGPTLTVFPSDTTETFFVIATDGNQDADTAMVTLIGLPECVWPGDADGSSTANNLDVLALGHSMGINGPVRPNSHIAWVGQAAPAWAHTLANGVNYVHSDVDGNGLVEMVDLVGIDQNYFLPQSQPGQSQQNVNGVPIYIEWPAGDFYPGDTVVASIILGNASHLADSVYGLAFSLIYDPSWFVNNSVEISYDGSWLGTWGQDLISIEKDFAASGQLDVGISLTNQIPLTGSGRIADITVVIDDLIGKQESIQLAGIDIDKITLLPYSGPAYEVFAQGSKFSVVLNQELELLQQKLEVFPNPAADQLQLSWDLNEKIQAISLVDMQGKAQLLEINPASRTWSGSVAHLPTGLYLLQLSTEETVIQEKIIIQR